MCNTDKSGLVKVINLWSCAYSSVTLKAVLACATANDCKASELIQTGLCVVTQKAIKAVDERQPQRNYQINSG